MVLDDQPNGCQYQHWLTWILEAVELMPELAASAQPFMTVSRSDITRGSSDRMMSFEFFHRARPRQ